MSRGGFKPNGGRHKQRPKPDSIIVAQRRVYFLKTRLNGIMRRVDNGDRMLNAIRQDYAPMLARVAELNAALAEVDKQIALHQAHALLTNYAPETPKMPELPPVIVPEAPFDWSAPLLMQDLHEGLSRALARDPAAPMHAREAAAALVPETRAHQALQPLANPPKTATIPAVYLEEAYDANMSPLDFMLKVMRDPNADPLRRDRMAMAAAPFIHLKAAEAKLGKREEAKRKAAEVGAGGSKFSAPAAPRLVANSR